MTHNDLYEGRGSCVLSKQKHPSSSWVLTSSRRHGKTRLTTTRRIQDAETGAVLG